MVQALRELTDTAPEGLAGNVLAEAGLIDAYAEVAGPIGPLYIAWGPTGVTLVERAAVSVGLRAGGLHRHGPTHPQGRPIFRRSWAARSNTSWPANGPRYPRWTWWADPVRAGGAAQDARGSRGVRCARTPGWRARPAGPGPCARSARRWPAIPSPSSSPATAWCAPMATSASTARVGPPRSARCWRWRAWTRTSWSDWPARASATWAVTRPRSSATPRAATRGASPIDRVPFRSAEDASDAGYRACKDCRPLTASPFAA